MAREQLYIDNKYIPLSKSINASITKSIADIAEPQKRKATYSKTTSIPNSKEAQEVFTAIYELNLQEYTNPSLQDITFNPTVKIDCLYIVDGEEVINGYCQLKSITQLNNNELVYNIVMFGSIANIFRGMGEDYLNSAAMVAVLDRWNHPFDKNVQADSWATQVWDNNASAFIPFALGTGYVYPLMDFGLTTNLTDFDFDKMPMCLYAREYMNAIFVASGYTWTSAFLDSTYFKSLIIPSSPTTLQLDDAEILDKQFVSNTPQFVDTTSTVSANVNIGSQFGSLGILKFTNEVSDAGGNYDPTTGVFTAVSTGTYNFNGLVDINATFTPTTGASVVCTSDIEGRLELFVNGSVAQSLPFYITYNDYPASPSIGARSTAITPTLASNDASPEYITNLGSYSSVSSPGAAINSPRQVNPPDRYLGSFQNITLNAGNTVDVRIKARYRGVNDLDFQMFYNSPTYYPGTAVLNVTVGAFYNNVVNTYPAYGSLLKIEKCIPKKIKQKDFFMSIVKMFNLWIDVDPNNQNNLLIEPREDFLTTDVINIQTKIAQDKKIEITPMGKLDAVDFLFTYKEDKDHYNEKYTSQWEDVYGERTINTTNDFVRGSKKTEIIFSPTPIVAPPLSNRVIPTIIEVDDLNQPKDTDFNIRILYYGGLKDTLTTWNHIHYPVFNIPLPTVYSTYPYAGHFNDPFNPTEDINFGLINEVYYDDDITPISITNNNLVNKYHLNMLNAYTNKNSKIVTAWCNMNPTDFKTWDFSKLYRFENAYFRLNKISNYNPTGESLTKCEFLYLTDVGLFVQREIPVWGGDGSVGVDISGGTGVGAINPDETMPKKATTNDSQPNGGNYTGKEQVVQGEYNEIASDSYRITIQGDNNKVFQEVEDVYIQGDNNTIDAGQHNITLINTDGLFIDESDVTYINGENMADIIREAKMKLIETKDSIHLTEYEFKPSDNRVEIDQDYDVIQYIINAEDGIIIYNPTDPDLKGTDDGGGVTFNYDTAGMSVTDKLIIVGEVKDIEREQVYKKLQDLENQINDTNKLLNEAIN